MGRVARRLNELESAVRDLSYRLDEQREALEEHAASITGYGAWLADLQKWMTATVETVSTISTRSPTASPDLQRGDAQLVDPTVRLERQLRIWTVMAFLAQQEVPEELAISVIVPTKNRRSWLERAVASITAQTYGNWELLVVDDASDDDTPEWLADVATPRLRALQGEGKGGGAARNVGLDAASGDIIVYLDDDNVMHPGWLKAVAWAFSRWTDIESLYGARIIEDDRTNPTAGGALPSIEFVPYDRARLEQATFIDQNVLAHRAGLPEARQDPELPALYDWDAVLRITGRRPPFELPAVACIYSARAPGRLSQTNASLASSRITRSRVHTTRPFRIVLSSGKHNPIDAGFSRDMGMLRASGASVAVCGTLKDQSTDADVERFTYMADAVNGFRPDVIVVYEGGSLRSEAEALDELGVPFAVRVSPSSAETDIITEIKDHRLCVGVFASEGDDGLPVELSDALTRWRLQHV